MMALRGVLADGSPLQPVGGNSHRRHCFLPTFLRFVIRIVEYHESTRGIALVGIYDKRDMMTGIFENDIGGFVFFIRDTFFTEWFFPMLTIL